MALHLQAEPIAEECDCGEPYPCDCARATEQERERHDLAADVARERGWREQAERERDAAVAMLEQVVAARTGGDWAALEATMREARKLLAAADALKDIGW